MPAAFECPRCQNVFVKEMDADAAFAECPSCGALALPMGGSSTRENAALHRAVSHDVSSPESRRQATQRFDSLDALQSVPSQEGASPLETTDPGSEASRVGVFSGLLAAPDPYAAGVTVAGEAPASLMLTRGDAPRSSPSGEALRGVAASAAAAGAPPSVDMSRRLTQDDWNPALDENTMPSDEASDPRGAPPPRGASAPPGNLVELASLATENGGGTSPQASRFMGQLSEDAFRDLEKAFDEVALRPVVEAPPPPRQKRAASTWAELEGVAEGSEEQGLPRPPDKPAPPPLKVKKRKRPDHLALSDEAKELAFLPMVGQAAKADDARVKSALKSKSRGHDLEAPSGESSETTDIVKRPASRTTSKEPVAREVGDDGPPAKPAREAPPPLEVLRGFTPVRIGIAVVVMLGVGAGVGAWVAPRETKSVTPRARAEQRFADGNQFYTEGRFDDALGLYKGAINIDRTYAPAYRAKGAALAKQKRYDEAAEAYREYLSLEPDAIDATDVKEVLERRENQKGGG